MTPDLPAELKIALDRKAEGLSRNDAAQRAGAISRNYREGGDSRSIKSETDALAYALARMPATYAAIAACLDASLNVRPDFAPASMIDVGAGPGTASWAAAQAFPSLADFTSLDANTSLRDLALNLAQSASHLASMTYCHGDALRLIADMPAADLVIASFIVGEVGNAERFSLAEAMWSKTQDTLLIVEPGTPAGYARIIELRTRLIAQGAHVLAPCPHDDACPLTSPDWCHFSQRLPRSRAHKHLKGASVPYEDEKYSYVILTRSPLAQHPARILAQPKVTKVAVTAKLCTTDGLKTVDIPHRDKANYTVAKKWAWGDTVQPAD